MRQDLILNLAQRQDLDVEFSKITFGILDFINGLKLDDLKSKSQKVTLNTEQFCSNEAWANLEKLGNWKFDKERQTILGKGVYQFLLSSKIYGTKPLVINAILTFKYYDKFVHNILDNANAGIIIGWRKKNETNEYYNLLFTGQSMVLEQVGSRGGDDYRDFEHLSKGVDFKIQENTEYNFLIKISGNLIDVFVDEEFKYTIKMPLDIEGKIGIRPWRSQIECSYFEVREI